MKTARAGAGDHSPFRPERSIGGLAVNLFAKILNRQGAKIAKNHGMRFENDAAAI